MKHQVLFSSKDKSKKLKCRLLQFLFGALRVNVNIYIWDLNQTCFLLTFPENICNRHFSQGGFSWEQKVISS